MEGTEKRIEERSITYTGSCARAEDKPVWQEKSRAASYNTVTQPAHYARFAIQPIEFILANGLNFLQASVIKYLVRYPYKNGMEDLLKCRNMLDRLIAEEEKKAAPAIVVGDAPMFVAPPRPHPRDYPNWPSYMEARAEWEAAWGEKRLVRDAGEEVGGQPASDNAEHGADRRDGSK